MKPKPSDMDFDWQQLYIDFTIIILITYYYLFSVTAHTNVFMYPILYHINFPPIAFVFFFVIKNNLALYPFIIPFNYA